MSQDIANSFIRDYAPEFQLVAQREGSYLRNTVRVKDNVVGESTTFQRIGKSAVIKGKPRHGTIASAGATHTPLTAYLIDHYGREFVDKLDEMKLNINERMALTQSLVMALARETDTTLFTAMDTTTTVATTLTLTSYASVRSGILNATLKLWNNDIHPYTNVYAVVTPNLWSIMTASIPELVSKDFVNERGLPFAEGQPSRGRWVDWNGLYWTTHTGLPGFGTATCKAFFYQSEGVGFATHGAPIVDVTWDGSDTFSYVITVAEAFGAVLIDPARVVEVPFSDVATVPVS